MDKQCTPEFVMKIHQEKQSWRKVADELNARFGVSLSHSTWSDYATGRREIADQEARAALGLSPRACPRCRNQADLQITNLLKRLTAQDLQHWNELHKAKKYKEASVFLEKVACRNA